MSRLQLTRNRDHWVASYQGRAVAGPFRSPGHAVVWFKQQGWALWLRWYGLEVVLDTGRIVDLGIGGTRRG